MSIESKKINCQGNLPLQSEVIEQIPKEKFIKLDFNSLKSKRISLRGRIPIFNIRERILEHNSDSHRSIARRQIDSLKRRLKFQPQMHSIYVELINIILLSEIVFRNLNLSKIFNKKSEEENE